MEIEIITREPITVSAEERVRIMLDGTRQLENATSTRFTDPVLKAVRRALELAVEPGLMGGALETPSGKLYFFFGVDKTGRLETVKVTPRGRERVYCGDAI